MSDLIRRDEAIQEIKSFFTSIISEMPCNDKDEIIDTALANIFLEFNKGLCVAIKELPTAEPTIDLVMCGECKYWHEGRCWNIKGLNKTDGVVNADDFCSYGELKEKDNTVCQGHKCP